MKRKNVRQSKAEWYQAKTAEYMRIKKVTEFDPDDVAEWLVETRQFTQPAASAKRRCKVELTKALRAQRMTDPQGREVRAMLGARQKNKQGDFFSTWSPLYEAKPDHVRLSAAQWRRGIRGEVLLQNRTVQSYNDNNVHGAQIPLFDYDFNKDTVESEMPEDYPDTKPDDQD